MELASANPAFHPPPSSKRCTGACARANTRISDSILGGKKRRKISRSDLPGVSVVLVVGYGDVYAFGAGGGRSRAGQTDSKPVLRCAPSQKGLFPECPQRHKPTVVRPPRPKDF